MIPKSKMPHFFYDADGQKSFEAEVMIDFFISWTLRCAVEKYKKENCLVQKYSKKILLFLLKDELGDIKNEEIVVNSVETWKQWDRIDLVADVELNIGDELKKYVIVFENKL